MLGPVMRSALVLSFALVCVAAAAADSALDRSAPRHSRAPFAVATAVEPGRYTGRTRAGIETRLRLTAGRRVHYLVRFRYRCSDRNNTRGDTRPLRPPRLTRDDRFRYRETGSYANRAFGRYRYRERIAGRLTPDRASGTYEGLLVYRSGRVCRTGAIRWSASRR